MTSQGACASSGGQPDGSVTAINETAYCCPELSVAVRCSLRAASVEEGLAVPLGAGDDAVRFTAHREAHRLDRGARVGDGGRANDLVANDPPTARRLGAPHLELRLHERHERAAGACAAGERVGELREADERGVDDGEVRGAADVVGGSGAGVGALEVRDARIDAELLRELAVADVDGDDVRCTPR